jgi:hypothetical protein
MRKTFLLKALQELEGDFSQIVTNLKYAGFLIELSPDLYEVADIYVPALNIKPGTSGSKDVSNPQKSSTRPLAPGESLAEQARVFLAARDYESALKVALSGEKNQVESIVVAADAALRSARQPLLQGALEALNDVSRPTNHLVARGVALNLALDRVPAALDLISRQPERKAEVVCHHLVGAFGNDVSLEREAWRSLLGQLAALPPNWSYLIPVTAGSRLLAVSRGLAQEAELMALSRVVFDQWWPRPVDRWTPHARKITHSLTNYVRDSEKGRRPSLHPYQVVSLWATLGHFGESPRELRSSLVIATAKRLHLAENHHRDNFREWAELDDYAEEIARHAGIF